MIITTFFAAACDPNKNFFGLPTWYKYLKPSLDPSNNCYFRVDNLNELVLIGAAIFDMLLRLAAIVAVSFVIVGGFKYVSSQGEPERTKQALSTIINALIGLVISIVAASLVSFLAGRFS